MKTDRPHSFTLRLTDAERHMLDALASAHGETASALVRRLMRASHRATFGEPAPAARAKR